MSTIPVTTDVDIDVFNRDGILANLGCINGRIDRPAGKFEKHPTGVYFQNIPRNPITNIASVDHKAANQYGYFKIDFLNVNLYAGIRDEAHLIELIATEPPWELFLYPEITDQLFHLNGYSNLLQRFEPKSVEDLAMILAIIRPSKSYLQKQPWDVVRDQVWIKSDADTYTFKKAHGVAYSLAIIVNLHLLIDEINAASAEFDVS